MIQAMDEEPRIELDSPLTLKLCSVNKAYKTQSGVFPALKDINLELSGHGIVSILGPSGCGKTTLLNLLGGLDHQDSGSFLVNGVSTQSFKNADWDAYRNRYVGFVFQNYNLIPYKTVLENVLLPLEIAGAKRGRRIELAHEALKKVGLDDLSKKRPNQLSGGQQQRVAIARSIVNSPSLVLADEPTGALDSESSIAVLNLLKEIAKERLVVLVTHNQELAESYSDRQIIMKDGRIVSDSQKASETKTSDPCICFRRKTTRMSFLSCLGSSLKTLTRKKARVGLTTLSCSFGILGVALVLAINNGFSNYVSAVEKSVASSVPISLSPLSTRTHYESQSKGNEFPDEPNVNIYDSRKAYTEVVYNNFSDEYFSYLDAILDDPNCPAYGSAMSVMYYRKSLSYHFMKEDPSGEVREINQYQNASSSGYTIASLTSLPGTILHELYGDEENMSSLYDTIAGEFPSGANDLALVLDSYNRIDFKTMKALGFYAQDATLDDGNDVLSFDDILGSEFRCYTNSEYYGFKNEGELEASLMKRSFPSYNSLSLEISDSDGDGVYDAKLNDLSTEEETKEICEFVSPSASDIYSDVASHKPIKCKIVGILRPKRGSYIQLMPSSIAYTPALSKLIVADQENPITQRMAELQKDNWFLPRASFGFDGKERLEEAFRYLASAITKIKQTNSVDQASNDLANFKEKLGTAFCFMILSGANRSRAFSYVTSPSSYLSFCRGYGATFVQANFQELLLDATLNDGLTLGPDFFTSALDNGIIEYLASMNSYSLVDSILIFPSSVSTKAALVSYLDAWNELHPDQTNDYVDIMTDFTSSLGALVQVLSIVLVVFASVSLIVSSIMTAIITYLSVLERTREIGVLRSCGARKSDVGRLFELECLFVGLVAGGLGVGLSALACLPLNSFLNGMFPSNNLGEIARLNPLSGVLLILVSMALSFISGLIPSRMAARKDPVLCLRSE